MDSPSPPAPPGGSFPTADDLKKPWWRFLRDRVVRNRRGKLRKWALRLSETVTGDAFVDQQRLLQATGRAAAPLILDVGAHQGQTTQSYRRLFPKAVIHAFEPAPDTFAQLSATLAGDPGSTAVPLALSDSNGEQWFHVYGKTDMNSLLPLAAPRGTAAPQGQQVKIETARLDDYARQQGWTRVDLLKIDTQGAERLVLAGAQTLLQTQAIDVIYAEVNFAAIYENQTAFHELVGLLAGCGYQLFNLYHLHRTHGFGQLIWGDALFVSPAVAARLPAS